MSDDPILQDDGPILKKMITCSMKKILEQGYVPYYGSVGNIPKETIIVFQRNELDLKINPLDMSITYHTPYLYSDRGYIVNSVTTYHTYQPNYTLYHTSNEVTKLNVSPDDITSSTTMRKYSLYIPKETNDKINEKIDEMNKNNKQTLPYSIWERGGGYRKSKKQKSKKRSTRKSKTLKKKSRKTRRR